MKDELLNIINKKIGSYYWNFSLEICKEVGIRKAGTPMILMNRFEKLRVSKKIFFQFIELNTIYTNNIKFISYSQDTMVQKD